jgi:uncharacterized protein (DUF1330 family)
LSLVALEPPSDLPPGPFISVFVVHEILDRAAYEAYQRISDEQAVKPPAFGGRVLAFAKPPLHLAGPHPAVAVAVIAWPDFDAYRAWRGQPVYAAPGVAALHAAAERESVHLLPLRAFPAP